MLKLSSREIALALVLATIGFAFSSREWILWMAKNSPLVGFAVYEAILLAMLFVLSKMGLVLFSIRIRNPLQVVGLWLITMAVLVPICWESPYINIVANGSAEGVSAIFFQSEDGMLWYLWGGLTQATEVLRWLTYVVSPFLLAIFGGLLVEQKIRM